AISLRSTQAAPAPKLPVASAIADRMSRRRSAVKSRRVSCTPSVETELFMVLRGLRALAEARALYRNAILFSPRNAMSATPKRQSRKAPPPRELAPHDYEMLAEFRYLLMRFAAFSEQAAHAAGLAPRQHQAL